jgi:hypothetical protein
MALPLVERVEHTRTQGVDIALGKGDCRGIGFEDNGHSVVVDPTRWALVEFEVLLNLVYRSGLTLQESPWRSNIWGCLLHDGNRSLQVRQRPVLRNDALC